MKSHIELLGLINVISGAFWEFFGLCVLAIFLLAAPTTGDPTGASALLIIGSLGGGFLMVLGIPTLLAGIGLLKRKSWARTLTLVVGVFAFFYFPVGTLIALYSFWVLTNTEATKMLEASI